MKEPEETRIKLPSEFNTSKKNHKEGYKQSCTNLLGSKVLPYDILRIIFLYLNGKDLSNVTMVCRSWLEAANHEKNLRRSYLIAYPPVHNESIDNYIYYAITKSTVKPAIGFFFHPFNVMCRHEEDDRVRKLLPKNCKIIILFANIVILTKNHGNYKCISCTDVICALLPQSPNVEISSFRVLFPHKNEYKRYMDMIEEVSKQDQTSKCVMIFCADPMYDTGMKMYSHAQMRLGNNDKNTVLLCDTTGTMFHYNKPFREPIYCSVVVITGSTWTCSITIEYKQKTCEQYEEELKSLKKKVYLQKHSVGFIFGCDTEENVSNLKKVEVFNRSFPEVPLVGFLGKCLAYNFNINSPLSGNINRLRKHNCSVTYMILTYDL